MSRWFRSYGFAEVAPNLLVGALPLDASDVAMLERLGVTRILNLVEDAEYEPGVREVVAIALQQSGIEEERLALTDFGGLPPEALERCVALVADWLEHGQVAYVHCRAGWQRSAAVAAGVVAVRDGIEVHAALRSVQQRKPSADPLPHQREDLQRWWRARGAPASQPGRDRPSDREAP